MLGTEVGLAGGVVYYPIEEGVRKDSEHSTEMYSKTYKDFPDNLLWSLFSCSTF